jgi:hypothetical protein
MSLRPIDFTASRRGANPFGTTPDELDEFVVREGWYEIRDTRTMERFLLAASRRFQTLNAAPDHVLWAEDSLTLQGKAWHALHEQFVPTTNDLRVFFTECDDFHDLAKEERRRLLELADALTGCGRKAEPCGDPGRHGAAL